ncbi:MAG: hypothetical protein IPH23_04400 [Gammaproteobacteria bacterium]|nr:hypothetical protein [Gammaproteobacteria bacterium]
MTGADNLVLLADPDWHSGNPARAVSPSGAVLDALGPQRRQEFERSYPALAEVAGPGLANNRLYKRAAADV